MAWFDKLNNDDRSHQDNFKNSDIDGEEWDNGSYQYCKICDGTRNFKFDRCCSCGSN